MEKHTNSHNTITVCLMIELQYDITYTFNILNINNIFLNLLYLL